ncbi:hypothetical protein ACYHQE_000737 [Aeromonas salmonicida]|uniref:hypothetical protein n=2 Tax=Aeromonas salmonicida TaxID=645 RepID=UPI0031FDF6B1
MPETALKIGPPRQQYTGRQVPLAPNQSPTFVLFFAKSLAQTATLWHSGTSMDRLTDTSGVTTAKGATKMAKASKKDIKKKIAARLEKIAKHEGKIKKLKKALK